MPKLYEETARLLYVLVAHGVTVVRGQDHHYVLNEIARVLGRLIDESKSDADAATFLLHWLEMWGSVTIDPSRRQRVAAITGTFIGNLRTMKTPAT